MVEFSLALTPDGGLNSSLEPPCSLPQFLTVRCCSEDKDLAKLSATPPLLVLCLCTLSEKEKSECGGDQGSGVRWSFVRCQGERPTCREMLIRVLYIQLLSVPMGGGWHTR